MTRSRTGDTADLGEHPRRCDALENAHDGQALRVEPDYGQPNLAGFCPATAPGRGIQALQRPAFIEKVRDIVGLYLNPPDKALVLCVDEKAQIQALDRSQPLLPMRPGQAERRTADYARHGTINLFAALDVNAGTVIGEFHRRHRAIEFRSFLKPLTLPCRPDLMCI